MEGCFGDPPVPPAASAEVSLRARAKICVLALITFPFRLCNPDLPKSMMEVEG